MSDKEDSQLKTQNNKSLDELIKENHKTKKYEQKEKKFTKKPPSSKNQQYQNDKYENKHQDRSSFQSGLSFKSKVT